MRLTYIYTEPWFDSEIVADFPECHRCWANYYGNHCYVSLSRGAMGRPEVCDDCGISLGFEHIRTDT